MLIVACYERKLSAGVERKIAYAADEVGVGEKIGGCNFLVFVHCYLLMNR